MIAHPPPRIPLGAILAAVAQLVVFAQGTQNHGRFDLAGVVPAKRCALVENASFGLAQASNARATVTSAVSSVAFNVLARRFHRRTWSAAEI